MDLGMGLAALGVGLAMLFAARGVRSFKSLASLRSPPSRRSFYFSATLCWLSFIPAEWLWLVYTQRRGDYPWWADSIGIPGFSVLFFGLIGLPFVLLGVAIALRGAQLPATLWAKPYFGPPYVVCSILWAAVLLTLLFLWAFLFAGPPTVIPLLGTLYLLLSGRAAATSRGRKKA